MRKRFKKGAATILAMVFVAVFATLSVAFYSMTVTSVGTTSNDQQAVLAQGAAESGLEYTRFLLSRPANSFPATAVPDTSAELQAIASSLQSTYRVSCSYVGSTLRIPTDGAMALFPATSGQAGGFYATVVPDPATPHQFNVSVVGSNGAAGGKLYTRTISTTCTPADTSRAVSSPVDFGVASYGAIHVKKNVYVMTEDTGSTDLTDATMMSASSSVPSVVVDSSATVDTIIGTIWVTNSADQVSSHIDTTSDGAKTTVKIFTNPPYFDDYTLPESTYTNDSTFAVYATWADFLADTGRTKTKVYIRGPSEITIGGSNGSPINASLVFGPNVTTIDIQGSKQVPTLITTDTDFKYAIMAPYAHVSYNGNTDAQIDGYIVANRFSGNDNNSSKFTIKNGGLLTLDPSDGSCDLGQGDLYIYLPDSGDRPSVTRNLIYRRYMLNYSGYQESY